MTATKDFLKLAKDCPYCEGDPSAGACCSYYGEQAFTCSAENCPVFHTCPAFHSTHHCEAFAAECPSGGDSSSSDCYLNKLA